MNANHILFSTLTVLTLTASALPANAVTLHSATPSPQVETQGSADFLRWLGHADPYNVGPAAQVSGSATLSNLTFVRALGDVNADGVRDVLLETFDPQTLTSSAVALAGPAFDKVLWAVPSQASQVVQTVSDLTGDGVIDPSTVTTTVQRAVDQTQGAAGAGVRTVDDASQLATRALDGATGNPLLTAGVQEGLSATQAALAASSSATAGAGQATAMLGMVAATGVGTVRSLQETVTSTGGGLLSGLPVPGVPLPIPLPTTATQIEHDLVLKVMDAAGQVHGTIEVGSKTLDALEAAAPDLNLDGVSDTVLLLANKTSVVDEVPVLVPEVAGYAGLATMPVFHAVLPALRGVPMLIPRLGDLNADGHADLGVLGMEAMAAASATSPVEMGSVFTILSGADGKVLATLNAASGLAAAIPFGKVPGISGDALLRIDESDGGIKVSVAGIDLQAKWSVDLPVGSAPLNALTDAATGELSGFADWTGDGVPDVASGLTNAAGQLQATVYDGVTGAVAWTKTLDGVVAMVPVGAVPGQLAPALAIVQSLPSTATGALASNATVHPGETVLTLLHATDGLPIWTLPLVSTVQSAALPAATRVLATLTSLGDVTGDGIPDVSARLEFRSQGNASAQVRVGDQVVSAGSDTVVQTLVVSGVDASTVLKKVDQNVTAGASFHMAPLQPGAPQLFEKSAPETSSSKKAPAPEFALVLGLAGIAVLVARRRAA